jgi:hypothetical protein
MTHGPSCKILRRKRDHETLSRLCWPSSRPRLPRHPASFPPKPRTWPCRHPASRNPDPGTSTVALVPRHGSSSESRNVEAGNGTLRRRRDATGRHPCRSRTMAIRRTGGASLAVTRVEGPNRTPRTGGTDCRPPHDKTPPALKPLAPRPTGEAICRP